MNDGGKSSPVSPAGKGSFRERGGYFATNLGWFLCLVLPPALYFLTASGQFSWEQRIFIAIVSCAVVMWMFRLVAEYIVSIFIVIACLTLKIVPAPVILTGFSSEAFFLAMSVFGIGVLLANSGLLSRLALMILDYFPPTPFWQNLALSLMGVFVTPVIPSANGRMALIGPMVEEMAEEMGYRPCSPGSARLAMSAYSSFGLMSNFFLSGKPVNFILLGLLSSQFQERFTFFYWMVAAGAAGMVCFASRFVLAAALYRESGRGRIPRSQIKDKLQARGRLAFIEWIALASSVLFLLGVSTFSIHKIPTAWMALLVLFLVLFSGELSKEDFRKKIDWTFLLFLAGLIGFTRAFSYLQLDTWAGELLGWGHGLMADNFFLYVLILASEILLIRFILPANAAAALFCVILLPLAELNGINPWVVGFCVLVICSGCFFPYQSTFYLTFYHVTGGRLFTHRQAAPFNVLVNLINIIALLASIFFWKMLGLLR